MTIDRTYTIPVHVAARRVGEETVIVDLEHGEYFGLDTVGARIWELIVDGLSIAEICDVMLKEYEVGRQTLEKDLSDLIEVLVARKLIVQSR